MEDFSLTVEKLFDGEKIRHQQTVNVCDGKIKSIVDNQRPNSGVLSGTLLPGFIDIQVNGGGGYLFNQSPDVNTIKKIGRAHQTFGTSGWLPTLVTDSLAKMARAADAVVEARKVSTPGILGIHFEGPHLSVAKKGVHSESLIREISDFERRLYARKDLGKVIVTLAPENVAPELIEELVDDGVIVCLGHSNASYEETQRALDAGATGFTHLYNAMSASTSREPGMVGAALLDSTSFAGLILDGIHVHPATAKLAMKVKENMILVTDAMPPVGSDKIEFEFFSQTICRVDNTLRDSEGRLAGSVLDMATAVKNAIIMCDLSLAEAVTLASYNPARFLDLEHQYGRLTAGNKASMVLLSDDARIVANWIDGKKVV